MRREAAAIKRYEGNTGRVQYLPEAEAPPPPPPEMPPVFAAPPPPRRPGGFLPGLDPGQMLNAALRELETEDLLLLLILWLLYRESGDEELLLIMAAMFLL